MYASLISHNPVANIGRTNTKFISSRGLFFESCLHMKNINKYRKTSSAQNYLVRKCEGQRIQEIKAFAHENRKTTAQSNLYTKNNCSYFFWPFKPIQNLAQIYFSQIAGFIHNPIPNKELNLSIDAANNLMKNFLFTHTPPEIRIQTEFRCQFDKHENIFTKFQPIWKLELIRNIQHFAKYQMNNLFKWINYNKNAQYLYVISTGSLFYIKNKKMIHPHQYTSFSGCPKIISPHRNNFYNTGRYYFSKQVEKENKVWEKIKGVKLDFKNISIFLLACFIIFFTIFEIPSPEKKRNKNLIDVAYDHINVGVQQLGSGDFENALVNFDVAINYYIKVYTEKHFQTANTYYNIGTILQSHGKLNEALEFYNNSLKIYTILYGDENSECAKVLENIGVVLKLLEKHSEAMEKFDQALKIKIKKYGNDDIETCMIYANIASTLASMGKYEEALNYYDHVLKGGIKFYGETHNQTAISYQNVADVLLKLERYEESLKNYNEALKIFLLKNEEDNIHAATIYNNIGVVLQSLGKYDEALNNFDISLKIKLQHFGNDNIKTASTYGNIGTIFYQQKKYKEAIDYFDHILATFNKFFGEDHIQTVTTNQNLASAYFESGKYEEALKYYNQVLKIYTNAVGIESTQVGEAYENIGKTYIKLDKIEDATNYYNLALKTFIKLHESNHPSVIRCSKIISSLSPKK